MCIAQWLCAIAVMIVAHTSGFGKLRASQWVVAEAGVELG